MPLRSHIISLLLLLLLASGARALDAEKDSLLIVLRTTNDLSDKILILNRLADIFTGEDPVRAEDFATQALLMAESTEDTPGRAEALYHLGVLAQQDGRHDLAAEYLEQAESLFERAKDEYWTARVNLAISQEFRRSLEYDRALTLLYRAMETFESRKQLRDLAQTYNAIGRIFYDQGNYDKAYEFFNKSLVLFEKLDDEPWKGRLYNNIGEIYRLRGESPKAIDYFHRSRSILFRLNDPSLLTVIYTNLGNTYLDIDQLDSARRFLAMGREMGFLSKDPRRITANSISMGKLELARGNRAEALEYLLQAYEKAEKHASYTNLMESSRLLSAIYTDMQDYKNAYRFFERYRNMDDSLHQENHMAQITQLEMNLIYDLEDESRRLQVQRINLQYFTVAFILVSVILVVVLLYGRQRIKMSQAKVMREKLEIEKKRLQEEIDNKNMELTTNVMFLVKKNELITYISEKLLKAKEGFKPSVRKAVDEILLDLKSNLDRNIWQTFEERFRDVHHDFYTKLSNQFPGLTDNDRKLCAFLRLNMSTKEISAITHQSPNTIEVARTRLRKKLNIANTDVSLNNFLASI